MTDTPRVTVPVEPTEAMIEAAESAGMTMAGSDMSSPDMTRHIWSAMLSAAPAPEGGAVSPQVYRLLQLADAALANVTAFESDARYIMGNTNYAITDNARSEIRQFLLALATREEAPADPCASHKAEGIALDPCCPSCEAPAEAGEVTADSLRSVSDETMRALLSCKDVGSGRAHLAAIITALRAQPQARDLADEVDDVKKALESDGKVIEYFEAQRRIAALKALRGTDADKRALTYIAAALSALCARQAREDAQPVAWVPLHPRNGPIWPECGPDARSKDNLKSYPFMAVYTHAAPDALRVAVEAEQLGTALADLVSWFTKPVQGEYGIVWVIPAGDQGADDAVAAALAALQAEQKGGAA